MLPPDVILIFDEVHRGKGEATQNAYLVRDSVNQNVQAIALSATIADDPMKLWAIGQFLGLHQGGKDYYRFLNQNGCKKTRFGMQFQGGNGILKRLHSRIYPEKGNRLRHSDLGDAFPETLIKAKAFDMDNAKKIANEYEDLCCRIEELRMQENASANILAEQTRARQRIELLKCASVASLTRDFLEEGHSVFIAVSFRETMEFLMKELNSNCVICGGQSEFDRRGNIDSFQRDQARVIIGITQACREGLNLHDINGNHPRVALIFPQPSAYDLKQVLGRVHRAGGKTKSVQYIVYAAGIHIEEKTCNSLDDKLKRMDLLSDGCVDPTISLSVEKNLLP
jgi:superfamily II DNA or RNA helicase